MGYAVNNVTKREKMFTSQSLCSYYRYLCGLVKQKKTEGPISDFWVFNGTVRMKELYDSCISDTIMSIHVLLTQSRV